MARPSNATVVSMTPGGIEFQWLIDDYKSKGSRDAGLEVVNVLVAWSLAAGFLKEAVGFTTWNVAAKAPTLSRSVPLTCPLRNDFWCEDYNLVDCGAYESRSDFNNILNGNAPDQDWCIYEL